MTNGAALWWRREKDGEGDWRELVPHPGINWGFSEATKVLVRKPVFPAALYVDDESLPDHPLVTEAWAWEPGFFAGTVRAELTGSKGELLHSYLLDVSPSMNKLGQDQFSSMIQELWDEDPSLVVGSEPAAIECGELGSSENAWIAFARLRRYGPELLASLTPIANRPRKRLVFLRELTEPQNVRRTDRQTIMRLRHAPGILQALASGDQWEEDRQGSRLDVPRVEETLDSAANRAILWLLVALLRRIRAVSERLEREVAREPESETRTSLAGRWPRRRAVLAHLSDRLKRALRQPPWTSVGRAGISAAGLTAIASDPVYSRAWSRGWRAIRQGLEGGDQGGHIWISPTWEIYERWCFLRLGNLLRDTMPEWNWTRSGEEYRGAQGACRARLELQPTFRAGPAESRSRWSLSKERKPDLLLSIENRQGHRFLVLDAKYRTTRSNVLDAMEAAHIYRDSLRIGQGQASAAILLVPKGGGAEWLERPAFQREHRVGVHCFNIELRPTLPAIVEEFFRANGG